MSNLLLRLAGRLVLTGLISVGSVGAKSDEPVSIPGTGSPIPATFFGMHVHRLGQPTTWPKNSFGALRTWDAKVRWAEIQPDAGTWDFSRLDRIVETAKQNGADVLIPLGMPAAWASSKPAEPSAYRRGEAAPPRNMSDWRAFVKRVAERYKGTVSNYEIWNEPNLKNFFSGSVEDAVSLTCEAKKVLKEVSPDLRLVSPSATSRYGLPWFKRFLSAGGGRCVDIIGYHFYNKHEDPESHIDFIRQVRAEMDAAGIGRLELWNTETGWLISSGKRVLRPDAVGFKAADRVLSANDSEALIPRALILHAAMGINRFYWYALDNDMMGLVEPDNTPKSAWYAYMQTVELLRNQTVGPCTSPDRKVWTCKVSTSTAGTHAQVRWRIKGDPDSRFDGKPTSSYDVLGRGRVSATEAQSAYQAGQVVVEWVKG